jgi:hypothetical protein
MMGMRLVQSQRLRFGCTTCGGYSDEHIRDCPAGLIDEVLATEQIYSCPKCRGRARVTIDDFIACCKCRTFFSLGLTDTEEPEHLLLHRTNPDEDWVEAVVLTRKEPITFRTEVVVAKLSEERKIWRARLREERAAARRPRRRHSKDGQVRCEICGPLRCRYAS